MNRFLITLPSFEFLITLYIILVSKSMYYEGGGENVLLLPFLIILLIKAYILKKNPVKIPIKLILYSLAIFAVVSSNPESQLSSIFVLLLRLVISILIVQLLDFRLFSINFSKIVFFIGVASLLTFPVIYFNIPSGFPDFIATDGRPLRNFIFFGVWENFIQYDIYRNSGLWWEPGAFSVFLNISFIFDIINKRITWVRYVLYLFIIVTIVSTTGIIVFSLLSLLLIRRFTIRRVFIFPLLATPPLIYIVNFHFIPNILAKFSAGNGSFSSRYYDFIISYEMFLDAPFWGYGFGSQIQNAIPFGVSLLGTDLYELVKPTGADGLTMFIAQVGILGFLFLIPFLTPKYASTLNVIKRAIIFISLLLLFNTQNFTFLLIFIVLTFYGVLNNKSVFYWRGEN